MKAVLWGADQAGRGGHTLRIVAVQHVLGSPITITSGTSHHRRYEQFLDAARAEARAARPGLEVRTELRDGDTVKELAAAAHDAGALVIGSRGRGGISGLLVGSTSLRLTPHAQVPVIVIPDVPDAERSGVVVGEDGSEHAAQALAFAFDQARVRGVTLTIITILANAYWYGPNGPYGEWLKAAIANAEHALAKRLVPWHASHPDVEVITSVQWGHPAKVLCREAHGAELLVVGTSGRSRATSLLLGSISHNVLHHAPCPVAVVPHVA